MGWGDVWVGNSPDDDQNAEYVRMLNAGQVHAVHRLGGKEARDGAACQGWARRELGGGAAGQNASESVHGCVKLIPVEVSGSIAHHSRPQGTAHNRHEAAVVPSSSAF